MNQMIILLFAVLMLSGCTTAQKTLHYATLGLVNDPAVSEQVKQDVINYQADLQHEKERDDLRYKTFRPYHVVALGTFVLGLFITVASLINIPALAFLTKSCWKVGAGTVVGAAGLSAWAVTMAEPDTVKYLGWTLIALLVFGVVFLVSLYSKHKGVMLAMSKIDTGEMIA